MTNEQEPRDAASIDESPLGPAQVACAKAGIFGNRLAGQLIPLIAMRLTPEAPAMREFVGLIDQTHEAFQLAASELMALKTSIEGGGRG